MNKSQLILPGAILIAAFLISGSLIYTNSDKLSDGGGAAQIKQGAENAGEGRLIDVSIDDDAMLGDKDAKVTIIEFSDYQCPFCRIFWKEAFTQIKEQYLNTGKARFVFRDFPLSFHPSAQVSAEAAECAGEQNKYWEFHDKIFGEQEKMGQGTIQYTESDIKKWGREIGLNETEFNQCVDSGKYKEEVQKDIADGSAAGVNGVPSIFINGRFVATSDGQSVGAAPFAVFKAIIEEALASAK